jgi:methionine-rich copper-binding protein CopC
MSRLVPALLGGLALLVLPCLAMAKAELRSSDPAADAVLAVSPQEVVLTFSEAIQPVYSFVAVLDGTGRRIDVGHVERDKAKATVIHVSLFARAQGTCRVNWRVVGLDKHNANGSFLFSVTP